MIEILKVIEELRNEMHQIARLKGFGHPELVAASQRLDETLNEYNRIVYG